MSDAVDDFLAHHGVKGMKWGVIRSDDKKPRVRNKDKPDAEKSKHRIALEAKYLSKGMSVDQARNAADKRIITEKILLISGAVTIAALGGYVAQQEIGKNFSSVLLKEGSELNYINAFGKDVDLDRRLYTSFKKADTEKYRGLLAGQLRKNGSLLENGSKEIYDTVLKTTKDIKAPSQYQAAKMYKSFVKELGLKNAPNYRRMNQEIVNDTRLSKEFMKHLQSKGFNALLDANDQFSSGYNTKRPLILFNAASSAMKKGERIISEQTSTKLRNKQLGRIYTKQLTTMFAPYAGLGAAVVGANKAADSRNKYHAVNVYVKANPGTKLSYAEIWQNLRQDSAGRYKYKESK